MSGRTTLDTSEVEERTLRKSLESKTNSELRQMALDLGVTEADVDEALDPEKLFKIINLATDDPAIFLKERKKHKKSIDRFNELMEQGDSMVGEIETQIESGLDGGSRKRKRTSKKRPSKKRTSKKGRSKRRSKKRTSKKR